MNHPTRLAALGLLTALVFSGCALFGKSEKAPHPLVGTWNYTIDTPQGVFRGTLIFTEMDDVLSGMITSSEGGEPQPLQEFSIEESDLSFKFNGGEYGTISVGMTLDGDTLAGTLDVPAVGASGMIITATRQAM